MTVLPSPLLLSPALAMSFFYCPRLERVAPRVVVNVVVSEGCC